MLNSFPGNRKRQERPRRTRKGQGGRERHKKVGKKKKNYSKAGRVVERRRELRKGHGVGRDENRGKAGATKRQGDMKETSRDRGS